MNYDTGVFTCRLTLLVCMIFVCYSCSRYPDKKIPVLHIVEIKEMKFHPAELKINKGDTLVWVNHDFFEHDITEEPGRGWSSSKLPNGGSWRMIITRSSDYFCSIHQVMRGRLLVKE